MVYFWLDSAERQTDKSLEYFDAWGGWNDDVELAQSLVAYYFLTGDERLRNALRKMASDIQKAPAILDESSPWKQPGDKRITQGFSMGDALDAEHTAEETTLVFPRMFLIDYGNPNHIELMTRLLWNFEDNMSAQFPGETNWGFWAPTGSWLQGGLLFKSARLNGRYLNYQWQHSNCLSVYNVASKSAIPPFEPQDVIENFKITMPAQSLAWYYGPNQYFWKNNSTGFVRARDQAWITATAANRDGKPALQPPSKILTKDLSFGADWKVNDSDLMCNGGGWQSGAWGIRHFYHHMIADDIIYKGHGDANLAALGTQAHSIVENTYRLRQNNLTIAGQSVDLDRQLLQWRYEFGPSAQYDSDFFNVRGSVYKDAHTRALASKIYFDKKDVINGQALAQSAFDNLYTDTLKPNVVLGTHWTQDVVNEGEVRRQSNSYHSGTDAVKFDRSDAWLALSLGGSGIYDGGYPTLAFSVRDPGATVANSGYVPNVTTLVRSVTPSKIKFWIYNNDSTLKKVGFQLWRIPNSSVVATIGTDANSDEVVESVWYQASFSNVNRGDTIALPIPPKATLLVTLDITVLTSQDLSTLPDLAIAPEDVSYSGGVLSVKVHNIGTQAVSNARVRLLTKTGAALTSDQFVSLGGFTGMNPVTQTVQWSVPDISILGSIQIDPVLDANGKSKEITLINNALYY